ncbi:c-type cytochrome biogenesis protein CcmI [Methylocapsa sp. S129]|uniref:c-type cytochrome biogenesis protein CcmI n=1 Tax=Methylocapsa sp. S129 TaxID=1641869 RepID=UPI00131E6BDB|nr:c-type cytochrome biogenesis protein CcmI [Methylocapsa sp. S129]
MLWVAFALMTGAAILCALWPLSRRRSGPEGQARAIAFHKAQLAEIDRDVERGQLPPSEAAGARAEAARRLIAASDVAKTTAGAGDGRASLRARAAVVIVFVAIPLVTFGLYLKLGSPNLPDQPILARAGAAGNGDLGAALAKIEAHLIADPNDGRGFKVIAPVYMRLGRFDDAAKAFGEALRLLGEDAPMRADYGEALTAAAGGIVTAQARAAFEQALTDRGDLPKARYYIGLAAEQDGDKPKATAIYQKLLADGPAGAPWLANVRERLAGLEAAPAAPGGEAAAIAALDPAAQQSAIRGMVERLAERLAQNGDDAQGWLRLIRAYGVLHETDKARDALVQARKAMTGNETAGRDLDALAREFGLGS